MGAYYLLCLAQNLHGKESKQKCVPNGENIMKDCSFAKKTTTYDKSMEYFSKNKITSSYMEVKIPNKRMARAIMTPEKYNIYKNIISN
jgi:hypothetical protein